MSPPPEPAEFEGQGGLAYALRNRYRRALLASLPRGVEYRLWLHRHAPALFPSVAPSPRRILVAVPASDEEGARIASTRASLGAREREVLVVPEGAPLPAAQDHDAVIVLQAGDRTRPGALDSLAAALPDDGLAYADEDRAGRKGPELPLLKPAWSPTLAQRNPEILPGSPALFAASLWNRGLRAADPRSPREVIAHASRLAREAVHVPAPLVTRDPGSLGKSISPAFPIRAQPPGTTPSTVTIVVPTRDRPDLVAALLRGLEHHEPGAPFELVFVDHASRKPRARELLVNAARRFRSRVLDWSGPFNFSAMSNAGAREGTGELILFMNDDVEPFVPGWLGALAAPLAHSEIAATGPLLLYPDGRVQHAGIGLGIGTVGGHLHKGLRPESQGPIPGPLRSREVGALTGACLCMRRETFEASGGFDERDLPVSFNDVDLGLRLRAAGSTLLYVSESRLIHRETATRSRRLDPREIAVMEQRWGDALAADPYLPPGLSRRTEAPHLELWDEFPVDPRPWPRARSYSSR